eukprot:jgi/Mesvir1/9013/Mv21301-RA.1
MDCDAGHPFADYNKKGNGVTLVGNWAEERALHEQLAAQGLNASSEEELGDSIYAKKVSPPLADTTFRVTGLLRTGELDATAEGARSPVGSRLQVPGAVTYKEEARAPGKRTQQLLDQLLNEAKDSVLAQGPEQPLVLESTTHATYKAPTRS